MEDIYKDKNIEKIESEIQDIYEGPTNYEVITYPADFTIEGLVSKHDKQQIKIPGFQRKYVWKQGQASRLIESFLLGLPVPAIFLYVDPIDNLMSIIDGQQRLMSIVYFFHGFFGEEIKSKKKVFKLEGLNPKSPFLNKTYKDIEKENPAAWNQLNNSVLRAFVIKQTNPKDMSSAYHIFERLNTGGTQLSSQEIRNCIYHGSFNELLGELNQYANWRKIFGQKKPHVRQRDVELILRFFAFYYSEKYSKPMVDFLSTFMSKNRNISKDNAEKLRKLFYDNCDKTIEALGNKPFYMQKGLNVAVFDSVFTTIAKCNKLSKDFKTKYAQLKKNTDFIESVHKWTTDEASVQKRFKIVNELLMGA
jgi:uncharacterized protein with ParB-like and HNH nuclease domain